VVETKHRDFYQGLRENSRLWLKRGGHRHQWAEFVMMVPDLFHLVVKLSTEGAVPGREKVKLAALIAYFVSPLDLLPEFLFGPLGYLDEVVLTAYVLNSIIASAGPETVRKHWAGEEDILDLVERILGLADRMLGSGPLGKLKGLLGGGNS
jgi:uncharacterized membrane protein YkvA (DUF1232 family)